MRRIDIPEFIDGDIGQVTAAAGTTQSDATTLAANHVEVGTATAGQGVILTAYPAKEVFTVLNTSGVSLLVYPPSGAAFNGGTANDALNLPDGTACFGRFLTSTTIAVLPVAVG